MVGLRCMRYVAGAQAGRMAEDARVMFRLLAQVNRFAATALGVTRQALGAVEYPPLSGSRCRVRVMARNATQSALAGLIAAAGPHLFGLAHRFGRPLLRHTGSFDQHGPHVSQIHPGAKVEVGSAVL